MFKIPHLLFSASLLTLGVTSTTSYAQNDDLDALLAMDLDDLSNITVEVASKRAESIYDAPGIVEVITATDLKQYGGNDLIDVMRRVTGLYLQGSYSFATPSNPTIRGQNVNGLSKHTLVLINGRSARDAFLGGIYVDIFAMFPISTIERIEIIRGPGSVLYGSGAFAGVINIVTKKAPASTIEQQASVNYGSFNTRIAEYQATGTSHDLSYTVATKGTKIDGWNLSGIDDTGTFGNIDTAEKGFSSFVDMEYNNFTLSSFESYFNYNILGSTKKFPGFEYKLRRSHLDAGYSLPLTEDWSAQFNVTYNGTSIAASSNGINAYSHAMLYEASVDGTLYNNINVLAGTTYFTNIGNENPTIGYQFDNPYKQRWKTGYVQIDYKPIDALKIVAGLQYNDVGLKNPNYSPRLAFIGHFNEQWGGKLLYGKAFRSSTIEESNAIIPAVNLTGNPDIAPEIISTYDAQLFYKTKNLYAALTYYMSTEEGTINFAAVTPGDIPFRSPTTTKNGGRTSFNGLEFEGKYQLNSQWNFQGSATYQTNENQDGEKNITNFAPNLSIKTGANYNSGHGYSLGLFNVYYGQKTSSVPTLTPVEPSLNTFNYLTANISVDIPKFLKIKNLPASTFTIYGDNLLEKDPIIDELLPKSAGRSVYGKFTVNF